MPDIEGKVHFARVPSQGESQDFLLKMNDCAFSLKLEKSNFCRCNWYQTISHSKTRPCPCRLVTKVWARQSKPNWRYSHLFFSMLRYFLGNPSRRFMVIEQKKQSAVSVFLLRLAFSNFGHKLLSRSSFLSAAFFTILLTSSKIDFSDWAEVKAETR